MKSHSRSRQKQAWRAEDTAREGRLAGTRILVVEDEALIAVEIEETLMDEDASVMGPCHTLAEARALMQGEAPSAAILDVHMGAELSLPLARELAARGVPFLLYTGQSRAELRQGGWPDWPLVGKPSLPNELLDAVMGLLGRSGSGGPPSAPAA